MLEILVGVGVLAGLFLVIFVVDKVTNDYSNRTPIEYAEDLATIVFVLIVAILLLSFLEMLAYVIGDAILN